MTALTILAWMAVTWVALGISAALYALYRIHRERKEFL